MAAVTEEVFVSVISLSITALQMAASFILSLFVGKNLSKYDGWIVVWLFYDAITHFTLEGPFVYFSLIGSVAKSDSILTVLWKEYGKADSRWLHSDPTIVSMELLTVGIVGPLALWLIFAMCKDKPYRHFLQIVLCVSELYGGFMTFCPEWLTGSPSLDTSNPLYLWVYLVFFNGLWVVIPILMLCQSWIEMTNNQHETGHKKRK